MKRIIFLLLCLMLIFAMPIAAYAEETEPSTEVTDEVAPPVDGTGEVEPPAEETEKTITETIAGYVQENFEEISVIGTILLSVFYEIRKHRNLNGTIGTLNNNAITVAQNSQAVIEAALAKVATIEATVQRYTDAVTNLLTEIRQSADEKEALEDMLQNIDTHLKASKEANLEFSNELAELLCLANIPNSKKEELYSRHRAAIASIEAEEVNVDDGAEA